jgi:hypothetical protein
MCNITHVKATKSSNFFIQKKVIIIHLIFSYIARLNTFIYIFKAKILQLYMSFSCVFIDIK